MSDLRRARPRASARLPVPEGAAELVQHAVQFHLQLVQQVAGLRVHLRKHRTEEELKTKQTSVVRAVIRTVCFCESLVAKKWKKMLDDDQENLCHNNSERKHRRKQQQNIVHIFYWVGGGWLEEGDGQ